MTRALLLAAASAVVLTLAAGTARPAASPSGSLSPAVETRLRTTDGFVRVIVTLRDQVDQRRIGGGSRATKRRAQLLALRAKSDSTQKALRKLLADRGSRVRRAQPFWIFNGLAVEAAPDVIRELARDPAVLSVTLDETIPAPVAAASAAPAEPNIDRVNAPALWALGHRGQGVVVASMDTGVDRSHPDLAAQWRGGTNSWFDPSGQHPTVPADRNGHGTWTMGVMVGRDAGGTSIGIAPAAQWIAVKIFDDSGAATTSRIHAGYQWLLDPDGDPATDDAPDVVNNSWSTGSPGCNLAFQPDLLALRSAGILPIFAAGNYGPATASSPSPANNPAAFAVGATDTADRLDLYSSRGPSACGEPAATFPELVAPGVDVLTTDLFGLYRMESGTSLAAPHAAGGLALLLGAFPGLSADVQETALKSGAVDLGAAGPDGGFGWGRLDLLASYEWLRAGPPADFTLAASPSSLAARAGGSVAYTVDVSAVNGFVGDVALTLSGLTTAQASWSFAPPSVAAPGGATLTVSPGAELAPGSYPLTISGTAGSLTRAVGVTLVVEPPPDFALSVTPAELRSRPGGSGSAAVEVTSVGGFAGEVTLAVTGLPSGAEAAFAPGGVSAPGSSTLTVTAAASTAPGSYPLTLTGTSGALVRSAVATLVVEPPPPPPTFALSISPTSKSVGRSSSTSFTVTVSAVNGFTGSVTLAVSGLGEGATGSFFPTAVTAPGSSKLTIRTTARAARGTYPLAITGSSGTSSKQVGATLTVK